MENWIVPCNIKHFDIISHFANQKTVVWKNSFTIRPGDVVYIYIGAPYSQIKYRCSVLSDVVDDELLRKNAYAIQEKPTNNYFSKKVKYVQMQIEYEYQDGLLPLSELKQHGLGQVQIQARTDRNLQRFLSQIDNKLLEGGTD